MNTYEIRILRKGIKDIKSPDIYSSSHISDHAAVRRAQSLAASDDIVEVWRGATCVYSRMLNPLPAQQSASGQGA
jgi:hypothetical protein